MLRFIRTQKLWLPKQRKDLSEASIPEVVYNLVFL